MNEGKLSGYRWVILFVSAFIIFMIDYMQFQLSGLAHLIMPDLGIDVAQFSALLLGPMLAGAIISIPVGSLADRYGSKIVVTVCTVVSVAAGFGRLLSGDFMSMAVMMFGLGFAGVAIQTVTIKIYGAWFQEKLDFAMGVFFAAACTGIASSLATSTLFPSVDAAFMFSAVALAVGLVLWVIFAKNAPAGTPLPEPEPVMKNLGVVVKNKYIWLIALACGFGLATATNYSGILPQAFIEVRGVDPTLAGSMAAFLQLTSIIGSIIGPMICRKNPKLMVIFIAVFGGFIMIANWFAPFGPLMWVLLLLNGVFSVASAPTIQAMPFSVKGIGLKYAGAAGGLVGCVSLIISYFLPIAIGAIAGTDYTLNFILEGAFYAAAAIPLALLPKGIGQASVDAPELEGDAVEAA